MPRYCYKCSKCSHEQILRHGITEKPVLNCNKCKEPDSLVKALSTPRVINKDSISNNESVGEVTKEYIELNKQILKEEKDKAKEKIYEPT